MNDYIWKLYMLACYGCRTEMCLKDDDVKCWTRRGESSKPTNDDRKDLTKGSKALGHMESKK